MTRDRKFFWAEIGFIAGIYLYPLQACAVWMMFAAAGLMISLFLVFTDEKARALSLLAFFVICGLGRFALFVDTEPTEEDLSGIVGRHMELDCRVARVPEIRSDKQQVVLEVESAGPLHEKKIIVFSSAYKEYGYGQNLAFHGKLQLPENFEDFDYRAYLRGQGIYMTAYYPEIERSGEDKHQVLGAIYAFRRRSSERISMIMPSPQAGIVSAMTLGTRSVETKEVMEKFNQTGTSHVIAVSGYHLVIVVAALMFILLGAGIERSKAFYLAAAGIVFYVILSGSSASAIRSGIMAFIFLLAEKIGRGKHVWNALVFSAAVMIFANPHILRNDVGFQLSFLATLGLVALLPIFNAKCKRLPSWGGAKEVLLVTFAAQIAVLPVLIWNFGRFSILSFLANMLILPSVPILMGLGFLLVAVSPFSLGLAKIIAFPAYILVSYEMMVVDYLSRLDWGFWQF